MACFLRLLRSNNNINVLACSSFVQNIFIGVGYNMTFIANGKKYDCYYLLANGIYPQWFCLMQSIQLPSDEKCAHFTKWQETCMKDVECCYGDFQGNLQLSPTLASNGAWILAYVMFTCYIFHNMILEDECDIFKLKDIH